MEKIPSFRINHLTLQPGIYVSRVDTLPSGEVLTTFDVRMTRPNREPALSISALHTIEHLAATYLRNHKEFADKTIYWGPMGCCTGNYLILKGEYTVDQVASEIRDLMIETFEFISGFEGDVPGATPKDCGNYLLMNLPEAQYVARKFLERLNSPDCGFVYPD